MKHPHLALTLFLLILTPIFTSASAQRDDPADSREIVIYTRNIAEIREIRTVDIVKGEGEILLPMIPGLTRASSVLLEVLKPKKGVETVAVAFTKRLLDDDSIWNNRIGEMMTLEVADSLISGTLMTVTSSSLYLDAPDGSGEIIIVNRSDVKLSSLERIPGSLVTEPSIRWTYRARKAGTAKIRISYIAGGLNWSADYRVDLDGGTATIKGRTVVINNTELDLPCDRLMLVAGEIHLAGDRRRVERLNPKPGAVEENSGTGFGDVRRWVFDKPSPLYAGHNTIMPLFQVSGIPVTKKFVYDAAIFNDRITSHLELTLNAANAIPLPAGVVRIFRKDGDNAEILVGSDRIDDTPAGSPMDITVSQAFDLTAERVRKLEEPLPDGGTKQGFTVTIGNSSTEDVTVEVLERLFGTWTVGSADLNGAAVKYEPVDARTLKFLVPVPRGKTAVLNYEIEYRR